MTRWGAWRDWAERQGLDAAQLRNGQGFEHLYYWDIYFACRGLALQGLHEQLNVAACACYGWPEDTWRDENEVLTRLLRLNLALTANA